MKLILLLAILLATQAHAATVNLMSGEQVVLESNTRTTVTCNGSSTGNCEAVAAGFRKQMEYCYKTYSGGDCAKQLWPKFKDSARECAAAGLDTCLEYCYKTYSGGDCSLRVCN